MAARTLFVDVWDADALMHLGTLSVPLRTLMRQQRGVVKTAMVRMQQSFWMGESHIVIWAGSLKQKLDRTPVHIGEGRVENSLNPSR